LKSPRLFKVRRNVIVFRTGDLELLNCWPTLNPQIDREIVRQKAQQTTSFRPKCMLKRLLGGEHTDIHEVAKELGMSSRHVATPNWL